MYSISQTFVYGEQFGGNRAALSHIAGAIDQKTPGAAPECEQYVMRSLPKK